MTLKQLKEKFGVTSITFGQFDSKRRPGELTAYVAKLTHPTTYNSVDIFLKLGDKPTPETLNQEVTMIDGKFYVGVNSTMKNTVTL